MRRVVRAGAVGSVLALAVGAAVGGYAVGLGAQATAPATTAPAPSGSAPTAVGDLVERALATPTDVEQLFALGDLYYRMGEYQFAAAAMAKILELDPDHVGAHLSLSAGMFNLGRLGEAEAGWRRVLDLDPENLEAHYNLGFLYLNQIPPDVGAAKEEWAAVLRIAPDSDVGRAIREQIALLDATAPSPAPPAR